MKSGAYLAKAMIRTGALDVPSTLVGATTTTAP
jgi:hypothetical protein